MKKSIFLIALCFILVVTACQSEQEREDTLLLKVLHPSAGNFDARWGEELRRAFPQFEMVIVETDGYLLDDDSNALAELIRQEKPDILYMQNEVEYAWFVEQGLLIPLDAKVNTNEFPLDAVYTPVFDLLKIKDDTLYGLPMFFDTKALFYNQELFDAYQLPYPHQGITWEEMLMLAEKFTQRNHDGRQIFGVEDYDWDESPYNPFGMAEMIARARGVHYLNSEGKLAIQTGGWKEIFEIVSNAYRNGVIYLPDSRELQYEGLKIVNEYVVDKRFLSGQTAMALHRSSLFGFLYDISHYGDSSTFSVDPFAWGVIPAPIDPSQPTKTSHIEAWDIFGIHPESPNVEHAWQVIGYLTGREMGESTSDLAMFNKRNGERFTIHAEFIQMDGMVVPGFAQQTLDIRTAKIDQMVSQQFHEAFRELAGNALYSVMEGTLSVEEALAELQMEGQSLR